MSRELDDAILKFIRRARNGDTLLCCFYEFRYEPVAQEIKAAIKEGVDVQLIIDGKVNEHTDKDGNFHESFSRKENLETLKRVGIKRSKDKVILREARTSSIQHNKFMVLLKGKNKRPAEVWTGSTNMCNGGIHGQTNVGHWVRNEEVAGHFQAYWELLAQDLGGKAGDSTSEVRKNNAEFLRDKEEIDNKNESGHRSSASRAKGTKPWRLRWPDDFRDEVLARLLEFNEQRHKE